MPMTNPNAPALLARCRETARAQLAAAIGAALGKLPNDLQALAAAATVPAEARLLDEATRAVRTHQAPIAAAFERGLLAAFDRKVNPRPRAEAGAEPTLDELTLVDDSAMELELALGRLVRKTADELDAQEVAAVGVRLGELAVGRPLEDGDNPLGPQTALEALKAGCDAVPGDGAVSMALVNSLQPHLALALRRLYPELNRMLVQAGVLPRIRHEIQRAPHLPGRTASHGAAPPSGGLPLPPGMTLSQAMSLRDLMPGATGSPIDVGTIVAALLDGPASSRQYGARMLANPQGSIFGRAMAVPVGPQVLAQLTQLQGAAAADIASGAADLAAVVQHLARLASHPLDQLTGELVAVVFDHLLGDPALPDHVKAQLARLQIVAFKAALLDRSFFARREHPLRQLLGAIAAAAADPHVDPRPDGPFATALQAVVDEVVAGFETDLAVFSAAREKVDALLADAAAAGEREAASLAPALAEAERAEEVRREAKVEVTRRLTGVAPRFVRHFLTDTWVHAVAEAGLNARSGADGWEARLELVDDLLWSVAPKLPTDVPRLTQLLPKLVPALSRGMAAAGVAPEAQRTFLDELMRTHAALLQAARGKRPAPPEVAAPASIPPATEAPDAVTGLDAGALLGLERGAVVEFHDTDPPVRARLTWISPKRSLYLFTAHGGKARHLSAEALREALGNGQARLAADGAQVVERALAAVIGESR